MKKMVINTISNTGSEGKSTFTKLSSDLLAYYGISHKVFSMDTNHNKICEVLDGVIKGDSTKEKNSLSQILELYRKKELASAVCDWPAASIDDFGKSFGGAEEFISTLYKRGLETVFLVPVAEPGKSVESVEKMITLINETSEDYPIKLIIAYNFKAKKIKDKEVIISVKTEIKEFLKAIRENAEVIEIDPNLFFSDPTMGMSFSRQGFINKKVNNNEIINTVGYNYLNALDKFDKQISPIFGAPFGSYDLGKDYDDLGL